MIYNQMSICCLNDNYISYLIDNMLSTDRNTTPLEYGEKFVMYENC